MAGHYPNPKKKRKEFCWIEFYEEVAERLLEYQSDRQCLVKGVRAISKTVGLNGYEDEDKDKNRFPLQDICPFTAMGAFNRGQIHKHKRRCVASGIKEFLSVKAKVPSSFNGIPCFYNVRLGPFGYCHQRKKGNPYTLGDLDTLWHIFIVAKQFAASSHIYRDEFVKAYDAATEVWGAEWNLTIGLFWAHPWCFPSLDTKSRDYIKRRFDIQIKAAGPDKPCNAKDYLKLMEGLKARFKEKNSPVHSFPELALAALK